MSLCVCYPQQEVWSLVCDTTPLIFDINATATTATTPIADTPAATNVAVDDTQAPKPAFKPIAQFLSAVRKTLAGVQRLHGKVGDLIQHKRAKTPASTQASADESLVPTDDSFEYLAIKGTNVVSKMLGASTTLTPALVPVPATAVVCLATRRNHRSRFVATPATTTAPDFAAMARQGQDSSTAITKPARGRFFKPVSALANRVKGLFAAVEPFLNKLRAILARIVLLNKMLGRVIMAQHGRTEAATTTTTTSTTTTTADAATTAFPAQCIVTELLTGPTTCLLFEEPTASPVDPTPGYSIVRKTLVVSFWLAPLAVAVCLFFLAMTIKSQGVCFRQALRDALVIYTSAHVLGRPRDDSGSTQPSTQGRRRVSTQPSSTTPGRRRVSFSEVDDRYHWETGVVSLYGRDLNVTGFDAQLATTHFLVAILRLSDQAFERFAPTPEQRLKISETVVDWLINMVFDKVLDVHRDVATQLQEDVETWAIFRHLTSPKTIVRLTQTFASHLVLDAGDKLLRSQVRRAKDAAIQAIACFMVLPSPLKKVALVLRILLILNDIVKSGEITRGHEQVIKSLMRDVHIQFPLGKDEQCIAPMFAVLESIQIALANNGGEPVTAADMVKTVAFNGAAIVMTWTSDFVRSKAFSSPPPSPLSSSSSSLSSSFSLRFPPGA